MRLRLVGLVVAVAAVLGWPSPAFASGVDLAVSSPRSTYEPGAAVPLRFVVTNRQATPCVLAAVADGSVSVVGATRDGVALAPSFSRALIGSGSAHMLDRHVRTVPPGGTVSFTLEAVDPQGLTTMTPLRDQSAMAAVWPTTAAGRYRLDLAYQTPPIAGADACPARSDVVTVAFEIRKPFWTPVLLWGALAVLLLLIVTMVFARRTFVRRSRPGRSYAARPSGNLYGRGRSRRAFPLRALPHRALPLRGFSRRALPLRGLSLWGLSRRAAVLVVVLVAGVLAAPEGARADLSYSGGTDKLSTVIYGGCAGKIAAFDPALWAKLNAKGKPRVIIYRYVHSERVQLGDDPHDSLIKWDYEDTSHIEGEAAGVDYDPCAELYHELVHAADAADEKLSDAKCGDSEVFKDEIRATIAENKYRAAQKPKLPPRTGYGGIALPSSMAKCAPGQKTKKDKTKGKAAAPGKSAPAKAGRRCATGSCAVSNGDPHLSTFDGQQYSFQAVGEFTAASSGALEIQVRQAPVAGMRTVSVNSAIAMRVGSGRVGFYLTDGVIAVHRDGAVALGHTKDPYAGDIYDVTWADGTVASVWRTGAYGLVLMVAPAGARKGRFAGLLGDYDGDFRNDVTGRLHPAFADKWRVTDDSSLFDYGDGQSTATFTDRAFPAAAEPNVAPERSASARQACGTAGVTGSVALANCVLDVSVTGAADFAVAAADVAELVTPSRSPSTSPSTSPSASSSSASPAASPPAEVDEPGAVAHQTFTGMSGQRAYVQVVSTSFTDQCGALSLHAPDGRTIGLGCLRADGEIDGTVLPADGEYRIDVDPDGDATGAVTLAVAVSDDQQGPAAIGGEPVTATIGAAGGQARFTFTATAGRRVTVDATGATIPDQCGVLQIQAANGAGVAEGCLTGGAGQMADVTIPADGTYRLVVDPARAATGTVILQLH